MIYQRTKGWASVSLPLLFRIPYSDAIYFSTKVTQINLAYQFTLRLKIIYQETKPNRFGYILRLCLNIPKKSRDTHKKDSKIIEVKY